MRPSKNKKPKNNITVRLFIQQNLTETNGPEVISQIRKRWPIFSQSMAEELIKLAQEDVDHIGWVLFNTKQDSPKQVNKLLHTPESNHLLNKIKFMLMGEVPTTEIINILRTKHNIPNPITLINRVKTLEDMV